MHNFQLNTISPSTANSHKILSQDCENGVVKSFKRVAAGVGTLLVFSLTFSGGAGAASPMKNIKNTEDFTSIEIKNSVVGIYDRDVQTLVGEHSSLQPTISTSYFSNSGGVIVVDEELRKHGSLIISDYITVAPKRIFDLESQFDFKTKARPNYNFSTDQKLNDDLMVQIEPKQIFDI